MVQRTGDKSDEYAVKKDFGCSKPRVRWDDSNMKSTYANVCNVVSTREEVTLLFGTKQSWHKGQKELTVELSDRIILNPYTAKRLSILLDNILGRYESRFGPFRLDPGVTELDDQG